MHQYFKYKLNQKDISSRESKIREGISVEVDYDGGSYEADILKIHGKFNYLNVYIYLFFFFFKCQGLL